MNPNGIVTVIFAVPCGSNLEYAKEIFLVISLGV